MRALTRLGMVAVVAAAIVGGLAASAAADPPPSALPGASHAVFVQTDNPSGNQIVAYDRAGDGSLSLAGTYATGGLGGVLAGSVVDHLASQGSLTYDPQNALLFAVNAGSDSVSVFAVFGDRLQLVQVVSSGGEFPVSVTVHGDLVYVLDALGGGSVQGYVVWFDRLVPLPGSSRSLGLNPNASPQFTNTPGQVAFSPDGSQLVVTTKANGSDIDVFRVGPFGLLSPSPVVNAEPNAVPFGVTFDPAGRLVVAEASGTDPALATFVLNPDGTLTSVDTVGTGQPATCWVASARGFYYASNAGGPSLSGFQENPLGQLDLIGNTPTDPGTVDASASVGGQFLYVQTGGNGIVDEFQVNGNGSLTEIGSVTVAGAVGGEGIVAF